MPEVVPARGRLRIAEHRRPGANRPARPVDLVGARRVAQAVLGVRNVGPRERLALGLPVLAGGHFPRHRTDEGGIPMGERQPQPRP